MPSSCTARARSRPALCPACVLHHATSQCPRCAHAVVTLRSPSPQRILFSALLFFLLIRLHNMSVYRGKGALEVDVSNRAGRGFGLGFYC